MKLFVDDLRPFPEDEGTEGCRDYETAIALLSVGDYTVLDLDYCLGEWKTGLDILLFLADHEIEVPHINIHSSHPKGITAMEIFCHTHFPNTLVTVNPLP